MQYHSFFIETSVHLSSEFADLGDMKFPFVLWRFLLIGWDYTEWSFLKLPLFLETVSLEHTGVLVPELILAVQTAPAVCIYCF
jgi:hypothetical protein